MHSATQHQVVTIDRGLFLVRYAAAEDPASPPIVRVAPDNTASDTMAIFLDPDQRESILWQPESCLVVRALAPGRLFVEVIPAQEGGSAAATVRIEPLSQGTADFQTRSMNADLGGSQLQLVAHITGRGDQRVHANEWIAGPAAPSRIEGICLEWPKRPGDLDIRYAVKTARPQPESGRIVKLGAFAGTRGRAMPIIGFMLEMSGPAAAALEFVVESVFLGAPIKQMVGKRITISGPTGREPLVGLRIGVQNASAGSLRQVGQSKAKGDERPTGRIRVFRNRAKIDQSATA